MTTKDFNIYKTKYDKISSEIIDLLELKTCPVDVSGIAEKEGIILAPGTYGNSFCGRIEFHKEINKFILFHPSIISEYEAPRIRFSIAHELGHYYLNSHREILLNGNAHNSQAGFVCDNKMEREADEFAAALLIPYNEIVKRLSAHNYMTLKMVLAMANEFVASATSAAIRYVKFAFEPCAVVLSKYREVLFDIASEEASAIGFTKLGKKGIPVKSPTFDASTPGSEVKIFDGEIDSEDWYSPRRIKKSIWEEAFPLGNTGLILTLLAIRR